MRRLLALPFMLALATPASATLFDNTPTVTRSHGLNETAFTYSVAVSPLDLLGLSAIGHDTVFDVAQGGFLSGRFSWNTDRDSTRLLDTLSLRLDKIDPLFGFSSGTLWQADLNTSGTAARLAFDNLRIGTGTYLLTMQGTTRNLIPDEWFTRYAGSYNIALALSGKPQPAPAIPEPETGVLAAIGLLALLLRRRRG